MRFILSVIAVCLVLITAKLYLPQAHAEVDGMDSYDLSNDYDFRRAVERVVERRCSVSVSDTVYIYDSDYVSIDLTGSIDC